MSDPAHLLGGIVLLVAITLPFYLGGNWLAQKIYPTTVADSADRRFAYGLLSRLLQLAALLTAIGLFYLVVIRRS